MNDRAEEIGESPTVPDGNQGHGPNGPPAKSTFFPTQPPREEQEGGLPATHLLKVEVEVMQQFVGETQGGYRIDLYYSGENKPVVIPTGSGLPDPLPSLLEKAVILSGNDWVTVNSEAVLDFDSRITIAVPLSKKVRCFIAGRLRGRAQLQDVLKKDGDPLCAELTSAQVLDRWRLGFEEGSYLPLLLSASFDVPQRGFDDRQDAIYDELRGLASSLFIGCGQAIFRQAPYGAVGAIKLDLYKVVPVRRQAGN